MADVEEQDAGTSSAVSRLDPNLIVRLQYSGYLFLGMIACTVLQHSGSAFDNISVLQQGCKYLSEHGVDASSTVLNVACLHNTLVYRISFALAMFFFLHFVSVSDLTCCIDIQSRVQLQTRFFFVKTFLLSALITLSFWIPNGFFAGYAWLCLFLSGVFLVIQVVLIVDFSHDWNDEWGRRSDSNVKWQYYLVAVSGGCYVVGSTVCICGYIYFVQSGDCNFNAFVITSVLVGAIVNTMVAIWVPHGSIVPCGIVFAYTAVIAFTTLKGQRDPHCNSLYQEDQSAKSLILSLIFSAGVLAYSVVSAGGNRQGLSLEAGVESEESGHLSGYCFFYAMMLLGSAYLAMLVTNWQVSGSGENQSESIAEWVKLSTVWGTMFLYLWSLLAPYFCCRDRDFGINTSDW